MSMTRNSHDAYHAGFTLIEIMIVMVIMAVMAAFVAPSFVSLNRGSVDEEARRLVRILKIAADESILTGQIIRWSATGHAYFFESEIEKGEWMQLHESPYKRYELPEGVVVLSARPAPHTKDQDIKARYLLRGSMMAEPLEVTLATTDEVPLKKTIRIEPSALSLKVYVMKVSQ